MFKIEYSGGKKFWKYFIAGYLYWLLSNFIGTLESNVESWNTFFAFLTRALIVLALLWPIRFIYSKIFKNQVKLPFAGIIILICSFGFGLIYIIIRYLIFKYVFVLKTDIFTLDTIHSFIQTVLISGQWTFLYFSILYIGISYWIELESEKERTRTATILAQRSQLQMLRYQLNPHFLFNSLNSVQGLIHENPDQADNMIIELSEFLRHTLQYNDRILIPISEEIEITEKYLMIEKIRFEERLDFNIECDPHILNYQIPCFITQPLVENAIKFGLRGKRTKVIIWIKFFKENEWLILEVRNTGELKKGWAFGIGLKNVIERLNNTYPGISNVILEENMGSVLAKILIEVHDEKDFSSNN